MKRASRALHGLVAWAFASWLNLFAAVTGVGTAVVLGAVLVAWSGVYNVAASQGHWWVVDRFLRFGMENSVRTNSQSVKVPDNLADIDMVRLGAGHFQGACAACHGAPGEPSSLIVQQMLPSPPELSKMVPGWEDRQLFWILKHGLMYAGMPGWVTQRRDDDVWPVVAFLRQLPGMTTERYRDLAYGAVEPSPAAGQELASRGAVGAGLAACGRCHGVDGEPPQSSLVPNLYGQSEAFLFESLKAYAGGARASGIMQPVAAELDEEGWRRLARYYAGIASKPREAAAVSNAPKGDGARGEQIVLEGVPDQSIPACQTCHIAGADPRYPNLAGQSAGFITSQLQLWKDGKRDGTELAAIMGPIAQRMTGEQIADVAVYLASLPPPQPAASAEAPQ